jgi:LysR family hydrogen peroxide-inducible transcriptional activator
MNGMTMRHLRYFDALARHGHFGRAARACAISQPALSLQMKELEALLGAPLIERGGRRIRLTSLGEALAQRSRDILRAVDELGDLARAAYLPLTGRLRIGVIPTVAPYLLPAIVQTLGAGFPGLDLRPREAVTARLVEDLFEGRLDCAVLALPLTDPALQEEPLLDEDFMLVRPLSDAGQPVPGPEALRSMRLLMLEEGHCFRDQTLSYCRAAEAPPGDLIEGSAISTLVQMVGAGLGVTLIPEMAAAIEAGSAPVALAALPPPRPRRRIGMVWRRTNPLSDQLRHAASLVRARVRVGPPPLGPGAGG